MSITNNKSDAKGMTLQQEEKRNKKTHTCMECDANFKERHRHAKNNVSSKFIKKCNIKGLKNLA